jgi:cell division septation protein DedD
MKKILAWLIGLPSLIIAVVIFTASYWTVWGLEKALPGIEVKLSQARINPFVGRVALHGLALQREGESVLRLSKLAVDISIKSLFKKQLIVDRIHINNGDFWLEELESGLWRVAGVDLPVAAESKLESEVVEGDPAPTSVDGLGVGFRGIKLAHLAFHVKEKSGEKLLRLKRLQILGPGVLESSSKLPVTIEAGLDEAKVALYGQLSPFAPPIKFKGVLEVEKLPLAISKQYVAAVPPSLQGLFSTNLNLDLSYIETANSTVNIKGFLELADFAVAEDKLTIKLPKSRWQGEVDGSLPVGAEPSGVVSGELKLTGLAVQEAGATQQMVNIEEVALEKIKYATKGRLTLAGVSVTGSKLYLHRSQAGKWPWSTEEVDKKPAPADKKAESKGKKDSGGLSYRVGKIAFPKGIALSLNDEGVSPVVLVDGRIDTLELGAIDSRKPEADTPFKISGKVGQYGKFVFSGSSKPLVDQPDVTVTGAVRSLDLPPFSPYVVPELGYLFSSGSIDMETDLALAKNNITSENKLLLSMFNLESAKTEKSKEIGGQLPIPMGAALDLLRSKDGDIKLKIPVTGTVDKPNIDFNDAISKVMGKVTKKAAKTTALIALGPVGLAVAAFQMVGNAAIDVQEDKLLKDIPFSKGSGNLTVAGRKKLDELAGFLTQQKKKRIIACGVVVNSDEKFFASLIVEKPPVEAAPANGEKPPVEATPVVEKVVEPKEVVVAVKAKSDWYYEVRVASFKSKSLADKSQRRWQKKGYNVLIRELSGRGGVAWQAVSLGLYQSRQEAELIKERIAEFNKTAGIVVKIPVANAEETEIVASVIGAAGVISGGSGLGTKLRALAKERASAVKNYLVVKGKIAPERIFSCSPMLPKAGDKKGPRVTLGSGT